MKKYRFLALLCLSFILVITAKVNLVSAEERDNESYTFGEVEKILVDYLDSSGKKYEVGSKEYTDFVFDQFNNDTDSELAQKPEYSALVAYMNEYVYRYSLQEEPINSVVQKLGDSDFNIDEIKNQTIKELKEQIMKEEAEVERAAKIKRANSIEPYAAYSVSDAKSYASNWYNGRSPVWPAYSNDCTNFVSQILWAGGMKMSGSWWADSVSSKEAWRLVVNFYDYWVAKKPTVSSYSKSTIISEAKAGDVVQFKKEGGTRYSHTMFVYSKADGTLYLSGHTDNYLKKNFKNISSAWEVFRVIKM